MHVRCVQSLWQLLRSLFSLTSEFLPKGSVLLPNSRVLDLQACNMKVALDTGVCLLSARLLQKLSNQQGLLRWLRRRARHSSQKRVSLNFEPVNTCVHNTGS